MQNALSAKCPFHLKPNQLLLRKRRNRSGYSRPTDLNLVHFPSLKDSRKVLLQVRRGEEILKDEKSLFTVDTHLYPLSAYLQRNLAELRGHQRSTYTPPGHKERRKLGATSHCDNKQRRRSHRQRLKNRKRLMQLFEVFLEGEKSMTQDSVFLFLTQ